MQTELINSVSFNTSHVVIYRGIFSQNGLIRSVSIHLMLLFIKGNGICDAEMWKFQYISCCYLSIHSGVHQALTLTVSIHLMLLFIIDFVFDNHLETKVSIHLMLLFIAVWALHFSTIASVSIHLMLLFILYR